MSKRTKDLKAKMLGPLVVLLWASIAIAQTQQATPGGSLQFSVMDQNGQPLAAAFILVEQNGKTVAQDRTSPSGTAFLNSLRPGTYRVLVQKPGFYTAT